MKWFDSRKGFGFILPDLGGGEVFVEYTELYGEGFRELVQGQRVEFEVRHTRSGPEATDVRVIGLS